MELYTADRSKSRTQKRSYRMRSAFCRVCGQKLLYKKSGRHGIITIEEGVKIG
jgi:hypothetical protein